jgi:hypothetical protein
MRKLSDSKPELERANRSAPAILCGMSMQPVCEEDIAEFVTEMETNVIPETIASLRHREELWQRYVNGVCC